MTEPAPRITTLNIGRLRGDLTDWFDLPPGHPYYGKVEETAILCYHIALPGRSVLVDAAAYEFSLGGASMALPGPHPPPLEAQLAAAGADPSTVTEVIVTHAHFDHINGLTRKVGDRYELVFPYTPHYLGAGDWTPDDFGPLQQNTIGVVDQHSLLSLVHGPLDLGDGLEIVPAPGETPGHQLLHLSANGVEAYFTGDLYHHPMEFDEPGRNVTWAEPVAMGASKAALMARAEASGAAVYFAHIEGVWEVRGGKWEVRREMSKVRGS